jgi:hypothetical protein
MSREGKVRDAEATTTDPNVRHIDTGPLKAGPVALVAAHISCGCLTRYQTLLYPRNTVGLMC